MTIAWRSFGKVLTARSLATSVITLLSMTMAAYAAPPTVSGLPESVTGTQTPVPPTGPVGSTYSTFVVTSPTTGPISTLGSPYGVWCWNPFAFIQTTPETYTAYSTYDPNFLALPGADTATAWQEVNWVINHKHGESGTLNPSTMDIQYVIWDLLVPGYDTTDLSPDGAQLLSDAQTYGPNFTPGPGQLLAVALYYGGINTIENAGTPQDIFIEYPLPTTPQTPGLKVTKTANKSTAKCSDQVTYTYTVTNTGNVPLTGIKLVDDNATPTIASDDVVISCPSTTLQPGQSETCTRALYLPLTQNGVDAYGNSASHTLITSTLPNGNIQVTLLEDLGIVDNSYGLASSPDWGSQGNSPWNHLGQDSAEFQFVDGAGNVVLDFAADYVSLSFAYPSGVGTAGIWGGAGHLYAGNPSNIVSIDTTITDNMNQNGNAGSWYTNSPPPGYKNWNFQCGYTVVINPSCFGRNGFGGCNIKKIQHGQCKTGKPYQCTPAPICKNVTNTVTATASAVANGQTVTVTSTAQATVVLNAGGQTSCQPPPQCQCPCWNCQHGDHAHCQNTGCHDQQCKQDGCPHQSQPVPCRPQDWWKQCNQSFQQCGRHW